MQVDLEDAIELSNLGTRLVLGLLQARAEAKGRDEITKEDYQSTVLKLEKVLDSGRSVGELLDRLKEIAESG